MTFHYQERNVQPNWLDTRVTKGPRQQTCILKMQKKERQKKPRVEDGSRQTLMGNDGPTAGAAKTARSCSRFLPAKTELFLLLLLVGGVMSKSMGKLIEWWKNLCNNQKM